MIRHLRSALPLLATFVVVACSGSAASEEGGSVAEGGDPVAIAAGTRPVHDAVASCPVPPAGVEVGMLTGQQLPELRVQDCDGNEVSLTKLCGNKATWLYLVHTWCPHVKAVSEYAESLHQSFASRGLSSVHVIVENDDHRAPTADTCKEWKERWGLQGVQLYFDQSGTAKGLMESDRTSVSSFIDKSLVITEKTLSDDQATLRRKLETLLSR